MTFRLIPSIALALTAASLAWLAVAPTSQREAAANYVGFDDDEYVAMWMYVDGDGCVVRCLATCETTCEENAHD